MTSYEGKTNSVGDETKQESKAIIVAPPQPKLKADTKSWNDVCHLADMLTYCRPHNSKTERAFLGKYIIPVGVKFDKKGNAHKVIGDAPVIWSCHIDTVHSQKGMQKVVYWADDDGTTFLGSEGKLASCLGADDTAGVFVMLEMIEAKVEGHYIFHRGEECGGIGSRWIAKDNKDVLKDKKFAIAFDRRDTKSIITHQGSRKCCSDEFAKALAEQIGMGHECDNTGAWTDTAAYVDDIAECTNISVGYYNAHGRSEKLNVDYLLKLRDAMCNIDITKFIEKRKPGENDYKYQNSRIWSSDGWCDGFAGYWRVKEEDRPKGGFRAHELDKKYGYNSWYQWFKYDQSGFWVPMQGVVPPNPEKWRKKRGQNYGVTKGWIKPQNNMFAGAIELREMEGLIKDNPAIIADLLDGQGYGPLELKEYIEECGGHTYNALPGY